MLFSDLTEFIYNFILINNKYNLLKNAKIVKKILIFVRFTLYLLANPTKIQCINKQDEVSSSVQQSYPDMYAEVF